MQLLQDQAQPSNPELSVKIIEEQFKKPLDELFSEWNPYPFAVGSVGQLFKATTLEGQDVAVKVQHEGIADSIRSDCKMIGWIKPLLKFYIPNADHSGIISELKTKLLEEIDYRVEIQNQMKFYDIYRYHPKVRIPKVYPSLSGEKVLTMDFHSGKSFKEFFQNSTQEQKDMVAEIIMSMFVNSFAHHRIFNADPHPGNYLFHEDDSITFLDFGSVKQFSDSYVSNSIVAIRSLIDDDRLGSRHAWAELGYYQESKENEFDTLFELLKEAYQPLLIDEKIKFDREQFNLLNQVVEDSTIIRGISPPPEATLIVRFTWGLMSILASLEANINFRKLMTDILDEMKAFETSA
jgi:predicted unusual protein kinase regulating ubiquinone biosynthesis (AarF/ABC1/UbiB family)